MHTVTEGLMGGHTKADFARELWESARLPVDRFRDLVLKNEAGMPLEPNSFVKSLLSDSEIRKKGVPVAAGPDRFLVVATGGH